MAEEEKKEWSPIVLGNRSSRFARFYRNLKMRAQNRRIEVILFLAGLLMAVTPMALTLAIGDNFPTTVQGSEERDDTSKITTKSDSTEIVLLSSTLVRSSDFPTTTRHKPTIRWKFMEGYGVWGVKFHSFSLPYTNGCISDYLYIRDLTHKNHKVIHCGETTPEEFISHGSKIEVELHSESTRTIPLFDFRVDHGKDEDDVRRQFSREPMKPTPFVIEVPPRISTEQKAAIISLSVILPIALVVAGLSAVTLAKHMNGEKKIRHSDVLPTTCPTSQKLINSKQSHKGEFTVLDFFVDTDKPTVKPGKVKLQDKKTDKSMGNDYADMPSSSLEICTTVAHHDVKPPPPKFDEKLVGFGSLM